MSDALVLVSDSLLTPDPPPCLAGCYDGADLCRGCGGSGCSHCGHDGREGPCSACDGSRRAPVGTPVVWVRPATDDGGPTSEGRMPARVVRVGTLARYHEDRYGGLVTLDHVRAIVPPTTEWEEPTPTEQWGEPITAIIMRSVADLPAGWSRCPDGLAEAVGL